MRGGVAGPGLVYRPTAGAASSTLAAMYASAAELKGVEVFRGITVPGIRWTGRAEIVGTNPG